MSESSEWVLLARILRPQGRKGEVLADLFTEDTDRFETHPEVWLAREGFSDAQATHAAATALPERATVSAHWLPVGRNAGRIVLHLVGVSSIEEAEALSGREIVIPASERRPLEEGAVYISELVGASVFDGEAMVGVVEDVQFPATPDGSRRLEEAAPLLSVRSADGEEILIPFVSAYLVEMDLAARTIRMTLPEGLVAVNRGPGVAESPDPSEGKEE
ncbi:MAG: ribosome maturation factor RimM [Acidobacteriaceae bacterium]